MALENTRARRRMAILGDMNGVYYQCKNPGCGIIFYSEERTCKVKCTKCKSRSFRFHTIKEGTLI